MTRLVDYFVVIGFDNEKERNGASVGKVLQRFPSADWPDVPFFYGLEVFCQPNGWLLKNTHEPPSFIVNVLTDMGADRHHAASLCFHEAVTAPTAPESVQDDLSEEEVTPRGVASSAATVYRPKCLVLVSRHAFFDTFRNCLSTLFTAYLEGSDTLETLVSCLVGGVRVPTAGVLRFSLGYNDQQRVRPPEQPTIPATGSKVALLFQQLGTIHNVVCLLCACLTDNKILFHSHSYSRLTNACHALTSLLYPLKYCYVYVPILPETVLLVLESPTPFILGVHSLLKPRLSEPQKMGIIQVDLDSGSLIFPDNITIFPLPEPYYTRLLEALTLVLNPSLHTADDAFSLGLLSQPPVALTPEVLDKNIRACFFRLFVELFAEFRSCLIAIRVHPKPLITLHKAAFLGMRGLQDDEFMNVLLSGMSFQTFVGERGLPFRPTDLFDEFYASYEPVSNQQQEDREKMKRIVQDLAHRLHNNEAIDPPELERIPAPSKEALEDPTPAAFPLLDESLVAEKIQMLAERRKSSGNDGNGGLYRSRVCPPTSKEVPVSQWDRCPRSSSATAGSPLNGPNIRRLDVLRNCLRCIFENQISDARKMLSAVQLSMKSRAVRVAFCRALNENLCRGGSNRATLDAQQFDLLVRLMNCALQNESPDDEHGVAYALLFLTSTYCRRLSAGVHQFAYTCVQEHPVWNNQHFWEAAFYHDVYLQIRQLYLPEQQNWRGHIYGKGSYNDTWNLFEEPLGMKLVCEQMKLSASLDEPTLKRRVQEEHSIAYGQAVHYTNLIVCMRTPLDASRLRRVNVGDLEQRSAAHHPYRRSPKTISMSSQAGDRSAANSDDEDVMETSSLQSDVESGFVEMTRVGLTSGGPAAASDIGEGSVRWITKFLDKVCAEADLPEEQLIQLHSRIPGFVALHIENLEQVNMESKRLPPINKPKVLHPTLMPGEVVLQGHLRVFLLPDGRQDAAKMVERTQGCSQLPAEGVIFLTNYRVIFKGQPCDPMVCEQVVIRSIPIMAMTKGKMLGQQQFLISTGVEGASHNLRDAIQIRSATFQLMKLAFDEEVTREKVEQFLNAIEQLRWPETVDELFALSRGKPTLDIRTEPVATKKYHTLRRFTPKIMIKGAKLARLKGSSPSAGKPNTLRNDSPRSPSTPSQRVARVNSSEDGGTLKQEDNDSWMSGNWKTLDRSDRPDVVDYERMGLLSDSQTSGGRGFRLSASNKHYEICPSYPAVFLLPSGVTEESVRKIAKGFRHNRLPVVVWCSPNGALLLRGAGFHQKTVVNRLKKHAGGLYAQSISEVQSSSGRPTRSNLIPSSSVGEQERYLSLLVALSPHAPVDANSQLTSSIGDLSNSSLLLASLDTVSVNSLTPEMYR